jgi:hypothetical protein
VPSKLYCPSRADSCPGKGADSAPEKGMPGAVLQICNAEGRAAAGSKMAAKVAKMAVFQNRHLRIFSFMLSFSLSMFSNT